MLAEQQYPALVLNQDFRPLSAFPLSLWNWQEAVKAVFLDRVTIVSEYEHEIRSPSLAMRLPSVIALKEYVHAEYQAAFTRYNVWLRDGHRCQYCGKKFRSSELTFDHVVPRSRGGETSWENIVTACSPCNLRKGNKPLDQCGMTLLSVPRAPTKAELAQKELLERPSFPRGLHEHWLDFVVGPDAELRARVAAAKQVPVTAGAFPTAMTDQDYWSVELLS